MKYASVCSGVEAPSVAWKSLGWNPIWFSEVDKFPSAVLKHHYPEVPNLGDMTTILPEKKYEPYADVDIIIGGTPCQSFSIAGLRGGLDDDRGNLALEFCRIIDRIRPRWFIWENVPGVLSSNGGRDFGSILGAVGELGYGWSYRILDAQYFGVPQRRRRVFLVGHIGGWRGPAAVLFERESLSGNPPPSREKGKVASAPTANGVGTCGSDDNNGQAGDLIAYEVGLGSNKETTLSPTLDARCKDGPIRQQKGLVVAMSTGQGNAEVTVEGSPTLNCNHEAPIVAYNIMPQNSGKDFKAKETETCQNLTTSGNNSGNNSGNQGGTYIAYAETGQSHYGEGVGTVRKEGGQCGGGSETLVSLTCGDRGVSVDQACGNMAIPHKGWVRRLTPMECERLQGFPDNYTQIPWRKKPAENCPDGHRYKSMGNSIAVPVLKWIGERIEKVDDIISKIKKS